jgi:hypothetical protein
MTALWSTCRTAPRLYRAAQRTALLDGPVRGAGSTVQTSASRPMRSACAWASFAEAFAQNPNVPRLDYAPPTGSDDKPITDTVRTSFTMDQSATGATNK